MIKDQNFLQFLKHLVSCLSRPKFVLKEMMRVLPANSFLFHENVLGIIKLTTANSWVRRNCKILSDDEDGLIPNWNLLHKLGN